MTLPKCTLAALSELKGFVCAWICGLMKTHMFMKFSNRIMWTKIFREYLTAFEKGNDQGKSKK